jgi:hypothetical protein
MCSSHRGTKTLPAKRLVVLPAEPCQHMALGPGSRVDVTLAPDGSGMLVRPVDGIERKPAEVIFGRRVHRGKPLSVQEVQGSVQLARQLGVSKATDR